MERWVGKIAVVTGASSGIGAAITKDLAKAGFTVIGLARRFERVEALNEEIIEASGQIHARKCDVTDEDCIIETFKWIEETFGGCDVLVNNAGIVRMNTLLGAENSKDIRDVINTNLFALLFCTREAFKIMNKHESEAVIININSIGGHRVLALPGMPPMLNIYFGSKHAVTASCEVIRQELNYLKKDNIRISSLSPGGVITEIADKAGVPKTATSGPMLNCEDISQGVLYILSTPPHVQVYELTLKPVGQAFWIRKKMFSHNYLMWQNQKHD